MTRALDQIISPAAAVDGVIYFLANLEAEVVKIGFATNLDVRLSSLQTGNHMNLTLLFNFRACKRSERLLHKHFQKDRVRGEWFTYTPDIDAVIDDLEQYRETWSDDDWHADYRFKPDETAFVLSMVGKPWGVAV